MCSNVGYFLHGKYFLLFFARQLLNGGCRQDDCGATRVNLEGKIMKKDPDEGGDRRCLSEARLT